MTLRSRDFKSLASASSAIRARGGMIAQRVVALATPFGSVQMVRRTVPATPRRYLTDFVPISWCDLADEIGGGRVAEPLTVRSRAPTSGPNAEAPTSRKASRGLCFVGGS